MRYQISCIGKLSNIEENKIIQKYIKRVKNKLFDLIKSYEMNNIKILNFAIGGPYGHGQFIKQKSDKIISFGKMTWSHIIARLMLVEQIYRIESIFNNHPYHK